MNGHDKPHTRMRTAVIFSIAAHLCALLAFALIFTDEGLPTANAPENGPGAAVTLFVRREPRPQPRAGAVSTPPPRVVAVRATVLPTTLPVRRRRFRPTTTPEDGSLPVARHSVPLKRSAPAAPRLTLALVASGPVETPSPRSARAPTPLPSPTPTPVPTPLATAAPTSTPAAVAAGNFGGLFSQNYPPAFTAPAELEALRSRLGRPVHIRVDVDESGHATDVHFLQPVTDPALEQSVRSTLLALRYVPADCNGLHCEGTLEIAY